MVLVLLSAMCLVASVALTTVTVLLFKTKQRQIQLESHNSQLAALLDEKQQQLDILKSDTSDAQHARIELEKQLELMRHSVKESERRIADWQQTKDESLKAAKEAMFATGGELFRKEAEEVTKKTKEGIEQVIKSVASLGDRVNKNETKVNTVWQSLATPTAAGNFAEIGLENTLKSYGLEAGTDYVMQYSVPSASPNRNLRPDAVVFLPADHLMVIDSKASQFFLQLAQAEGKYEEKELLTKLTKTMNEHLKSLASKGYREAVKDYARQAEKNIKDVNHVFTVLFMQSEAHIERVLSADPSLFQRAKKHNIILSGPAGLASTMSLAQYEIAREKQSQNYRVITEELSNLLGSLETVLSHTLKVGNGIRSISEHYRKLTASINGNFLPKARKISQLGIELPKNKSLPGNLPNYHLVADGNPVIEGELVDS